MKALKEFICNYLSGFLFCLAFLLEMPNYPFTFLVEQLRMYTFYKKCKKDYDEDLDTLVNGRKLVPFADRNLTDEEFPKVRRLHVVLVPTLKGAKNLFNKVSKIYAGVDQLTFTDEKYVKIVYYTHSRALMLFFNDDLGQFSEIEWEHAFTNIINDLIGGLKKCGEIEEQEVQMLEQADTLVCISVSDTITQLDFHFDVSCENVWEKEIIMEQIVNSWEWENLGNRFSIYMQSQVLRRLVSCGFWYSLAVMINYKSWIRVPFYGKLSIVLILVYIILPYFIWSGIDLLMKGVEIDEGCVS